MEDSIRTCNAQLHVSSLWAVGIDDCYRYKCSSIEPGHEGEYVAKCSARKSIPSMPIRVRFRTHPEVGHIVVAEKCEIPGSSQLGGKLSLEDDRGEFAIALGH
jgi:hypothetical protein